MDARASAPPRLRLAGRADAGDAQASQENEEAAVGRLAVLDSDRGFLLVLARRLQGAGWRHEVLAKRPSTKRIAAMEIDALIVDTAMLGANPLDWLARLCGERGDLSVIVCSTDSSVTDRVAALRFGVDHWLAKPCHPEELVARLEAATLRGRRPAGGPGTATMIGEVEIRPDQFQAFVGETSLGLTRREYQLLRLLCRAGGEVLPRERIYEALWGYEMTRNDRSVDVFVHKLRRKLEQGSPGWSYIHTHFGVGYQLAPQLGVAAEPVAA